MPNWYCRLRANMFDPANPIGAVMKITFEYPQRCVPLLRRRLLVASKIAFNIGPSGAQLDYGCRLLTSHRAKCIAANGTMSHCSNGDRPVPIPGNLGIADVYSQFRRTTVFSHSL